MSAVSNTSPICYLVLIGADQLLRSIFESILIPLEVQAELRHRDAPAAVREWISGPPDWLSVAAIAESDDTDLQRLDLGERAAILLAETASANFIILDDRPAREAATSRGLQVTGTLGVLSEGASRGLVDLPMAIDGLLSTTFRASPTMVRSLLRKHGFE